MAYHLFFNCVRACVALPQAALHWAVDALLSVPLFSLLAAAIHPSLIPGGVLFEEQYGTLELQHRCGSPWALRRQVPSQAASMIAALWAVLLGR